MFFIELNILLYMIISRHRRQQNAAPAQPASPPPPPHQKEKEATESMGHALDTAERGCYRTLLFRKPLEVRLKLAVTLRHLSTGESYTSLQYHWRVGRTTICKFVPQVCKVILKEFQQEYLMCPTDPEDWKKIERFRNRFRNRKI